VERLEESYKKIEESYKELEESHKELIKSNEKMQKEINDLKTTKSATTNNTVNGDINTVMLNAYGKEDIAHLSENDIRAILNQGFESISKYIESVHFSENAPQNKNICISNRRDNTVNTYDGKKWVLIDKAEFLKEIKENGINFIKKNIDVLNKSDTSDKKIINEINIFIKKYRENDDENDNKQFKKIDKDIQLILYNNRNKVTKK
jgi:hypothetical protein